MEYFIYILLFMFGASVASFIFVYLENRNYKSVLNLNDRSECKSCKTKLSFFELIPVFSFLFLGGRCLTCRAKIPFKLFLGELVMGVWFLFSFLYLQNNNYSDVYFYINYIFILIFGIIFFVLAVEDYENMEISSNVMYLFLSVAILKIIINILSLNDFDKYFYEIITSIFIISPFWIIYFLNKNWIGEADPYIFTSIAIFFSSQFTLSLFLYSVWLGSIFGILYLYFINKKFERGVRLPFIPIIFLSTLLIIVFNYHFLQISDILFLNEILFS